MSLHSRSFQNGIRLHSDSVLLLEKECFASSFALSMLASEEIGKGFAIEEIVFQARLGEGLGDRQDSPETPCYPIWPCMSVTWLDRIALSGEKDATTSKDQE